MTMNQVIIPRLFRRGGPETSRLPSDATTPLEERKQPGPERARALIRASRVRDTIANSDGCDHQDCKPPFQGSIVSMAHPGAMDGSHPSALRVPAL